MQPQLLVNAVTGQVPIRGFSMSGNATYRASPVIVMER